MRLFHRQSDASARARFEAKLSAANFPPDAIAAFCTVPLEAFDGQTLEQVAERRGWNVCERYVDRLWAAAARYGVATGQTTTTNKARRRLKDALKELPR